MEVVTSRAEVRARTAEWKRAGERVALVPTMGALHQGHLSLLEIARREADRVAISIFVNPTQFGPGEDFERYPRDLGRDLELARQTGADLAFTPPVNEIYPDGEPWVVVVPEHGADRLDGRIRPGHFRGVLTVVAKLFGIFQPTIAIFGQKDYQQLTLIRRMVRDLDMPIGIVAGPIVREADGLAMSSRNRYFSEEERERARSLSVALRECEELFLAGVSDPTRYREAMRRRLDPFTVPEYAEVVDGETLEEVTEVGPGTVCAVAARVGTTRLIDNTVLGSNQRI